MVAILPNFSFYILRSNCSRFLSFDVVIRNSRRIKKCRSTTSNPVKNLKAIILEIKNACKRMRFNRIDRFTVTLHAARFYTPLSPPGVQFAVSGTLFYTEFFNISLTVGMFSDFNPCAVVTRCTERQTDVRFERVDGNLFYAFVRRLVMWFRLKKKSK